MHCIVSDFCPLDGWVYGLVVCHFYFKRRNGDWAWHPEHSLRGKKSYPLTLMQPHPSWTLKTLALKEEGRFKKKPTNSLTTVVQVPTQQNTRHKFPDKGFKRTVIKYGQRNQREKQTYLWRITKEQNQLNEARTSLWDMEVDFSKERNTKMHELKYRKEKIQQFKCKHLWKASPINRPWEDGRSRLEIR